MKVWFALFVGGLLLSNGSLCAQGTAFTYQGRLMDNANPANGLYVMMFTLYDSLVNGDVAGGPVFTTIEVSNGLFTTSLDFGLASLTGGDRWLEIAAVANGSEEPLSVLQPRQLLAHSPYALYATAASSLASSGNNLEMKINGMPALRLQQPWANSESVNIIGGWLGNTALNGIVGATISGGGAGEDLLDLPAPNIVGADFGTVAGGAGNSVGIAADYGTISGGSENSVKPSANYSAIGGGRENSIESFAQCATISAGVGNTIQSYSGFATIGGGIFNNIARFASYATIAGGLQNMVQTKALHAVIAGGFANTIEHDVDFGSIGGGNGNLIQGDADFATIPGGRENSAATLAFAAGNRAKANHTGAFVWGDSTDGDVASTNQNSVTLRAAGGYRFFSDPNMSTGVHLEAGGGSWANLSDRAAKTNFADISASEVLNKLAAMPVCTWNYKAQNEAVRHMGPTAQDFHKAFGLGADDKRISTVDADGVTFAALQGLNQKLEKALAAKDAEIQSLKDSVGQLRIMIDRLGETRAER